MLQYAQNFPKTSFSNIVKFTPDSNQRAIKKKNYNK